MRRFDEAWDAQVLQEQLDEDLAQVTVTPDLKQRIVSATIKATRPKSLRERIAAFLEMEITFTLPQLATGVLAVLLVAGIYWFEWLSIDEATRAFYRLVEESMRQEIFPLSGPM